MEARVFLVGPWASDDAVLADLRTAVRRMGGVLAQPGESASSLVRIRRIGAERWIEADAPLVRATTARPGVCAFEVVVERWGRTRCLLYRVRVDPKTTDVLGDGLARTDVEELPIPDGIDDEDIDEVGCDLALSRIAGDGDPVGPGSVGTSLVFYRAHGIGRDE